MSLGITANRPKRAPTITQAGITQVWGVPEGFDALLLVARLAEHDGPLLHVARDDAGLARLADLLAYFSPHAEILRFPAWDCLPYDRVSPNPVIVSERVATLARLVEKPAAGAPRRIVLTTVNALVQRVPPRRPSRAPSLSVKVGESLDSAFLSELLVANGYHRVDTVMEPGEFATRGGIFDVYPSGETEPVRLDLFGDEVDNIRGFEADHAALDRQAKRVRAAPGRRAARSTPTACRASAPAGGRISARIRPATRST